MWCDSWLMFEVLCSGACYFVMFFLSFQRYFTLLVLRTVIKTTSGKMDHNYTRVNFNKTNEMSFLKGTSV